MQTIETFDRPDMEKVGLYLPGIGKVIGARDEGEWVAFDGNGYADDARVSPTHWFTLPEDPE